MRDELQEMQSRVGSMPPRVAGTLLLREERREKEKRTDGKRGTALPQLTHPRAENGAILLCVLFSD